MTIVLEPAAQARNRAVDHTEGQDRGLDPTLGTD
jgi:hypothetical protein